MEVVRPLLGGVMIGTSATMLLTLNGRIAGISGIVGGMFSREEDRGWRGAFLAGLVLGGVALLLLAPSSMKVEYAPSLPMAIVAGVLVGFGTQLGNGCTSGHGVCGISRLSLRSILATMVFIATGVLTVFMVKR